MTAASATAKLHAALQAKAQKALKQTADNVEQALEKNTPKRTGVTAKSWKQTKEAPNRIVIHTELPSGQPARYLKELNYGNAQQAPTGFIEQSIAEALEKNRRG